MPLKDPEARRVARAAYYQKNKERDAARAKQYRDTHKEEIAVQKAAYDKAHRTERTQATARLRAASPGLTKKYYQQNKANQLAASKRWQKANPELVRAYGANRRARKMGNGGQHTAEEWLAVLARSNGRCMCCGSKDNIHKDHIVPLAKGGSNEASNLQPLCATCNLSKGTKTIDYRRRSDWLWI